MGKYNTTLIIGENIACQSDSKFLTRLRKAKRQGILTDFTVVNRDFNTVKQMDSYLLAVADINSVDVFVTSNSTTIKEISKIFSEK